MYSYTYLHVHIYVCEQIVIQVTLLCLFFIFCLQVLKAVRVVLLDVPRQHKAGLTEK